MMRDRARAAPVQRRRRAGAPARSSSCPPASASGAGSSAGDRIAWASRNVVNDDRDEGEPRAAGRAARHRARRERRSALRQAVALPARGARHRRRRPDRADALSGSLADADVDAVLLDAGDEHRRRPARAQRRPARSGPSSRSSLVAETPGDAGPESVRVYDKWQETDAAIDAVEQAIAEKASCVEGRFMANASSRLVDECRHTRGRCRGQRVRSAGSGPWDGGAEP